MDCNICADRNVGPDHTKTEKHQNNEVLYEYSTNWSHLTRNRKGAVVTCNVISSFTDIADSADGRIKISVMPNEEIKFHFTISNECKEKELKVNFIQMPQNHLNFTMNDHDIGLGGNPVTLASKQILPKQIYVQFISRHIGQYEMSIIFSFTKKGRTEKIVIVRDMVVYVETKPVIHQKITSPYAKKKVMAPELIKCTKRARGSDNLFRIPKNYKPLYVSDLKVDDNAPEYQKELAADILDVFTTGITKENYVRFFHNLLWYEETIIRISLKNYNMTAVELMSTPSDCLTLFVPGLAEKRPSLLLGDLLFVKPEQNSEVMFEAVITDINDNHINIGGLDEAFWDYYNQNARFEIRFFLSRLQLERMHLAVDSVLNEGFESRVLPVKNPKQVNPVPMTKFYNVRVQSNPEQRLAVERIVAGASGTAPYLLHGPPGTGKTVTVVEAVLQLVNKSAMNRILVCTDSNMAADHVATMLLKYGHMFSEKKLLLRANSKYRVWETLPESLYHYSNGTCFYDFHPVSIDDFLSYRIVITTLSHSAKFARQFKRKNEARPITHLFIDEAAQSSEPSSLIPIVGLLQTRGALVLAGDPLQLGPVVISHAARARGLGLSMMERLKQTCPLYNDEDPDYTVMLLNNFRSHEDILHLPNQLFYNGQLKTYAAEDGISHVDILGEELVSRAIVFHGVLSKEQRMGKSPSYFNTMEIEIVQMYVKLLISDYEVQQEDIGIVTPYVRQVYKIKAWLKKEQLSKLEVGTVEAFQGKEKRVIIISTVRANCSLLQHDAKFQLGFLVDDKRFNVAVTRAKAKLIIIGNPLCLEKDIKWLAYMQQCRQFGTYRGFDPAGADVDATRKELLERIAPILKDLKTSREKKEKALLEN